MNKFESEMRDVLRGSERELDSDTLRELSQRRNKALAQVKKPYRGKQFALATGMTLASLLVLVVMLSPDFTNRELQPPPQEQFLSSEGRDLYENMDFYLWLAARDDNLRG